MTPESVNAQEAALEALVAASLRCPEKLPDITENEIRRFVEQKVTLDAEDEAALADTKGELFKTIKTILTRGRQGQQVPGSTGALRLDHPIPASLSAFASRQKLSMLETRQLLGMRLEILGHRSSPGSDDLERFDWERFYNRVKEFLK
jgi:hypothetical protein